jgi:UDP-N-acetylmuramyl pentapeptide phosphotransferase/UDP-N-acetylglucosamine-1-phosphate transferase
MLAQFLSGSLHFAVAFAATLAAARLFEPLARRLGRVDHPRGRKVHASALHARLFLGGAAAGKPTAR